HAVAGNEIVVAPDAGAGRVDRAGGLGLGLDRIAAGVGDHLAILIADLDLLAIALRPLHARGVADGAVDGGIDGLINFAVDLVLDPIGGPTDDAADLGR